MSEYGKAYREQLGAARGQSLALQEHERAMIPIIKQQSQAELVIARQTATTELDYQNRLFKQQLIQSDQSFAQEMIQAEKLWLFSDRVTEAEDKRLAALAADAPGPGQVLPAAIVAPGSMLPATGGSKTLIYAGLAIAAYFFLRS